MSNFHDQEFGKKWKKPYMHLDCCAVFWQVVLLWLFRKVNTQTNQEKQSTYSEKFNICSALNLPGVFLHIALYSRAMQTKCLNMQWHFTTLMFRPNLMVGFSFILTFWHFATNRNELKLWERLSLFAMENRRYYHI